jgi:catechol 2,3-dioxygenase-like lactoylglutathione lyase family enzyme
MLTSAPIVPYIPVANVARARKFYEEKVGLKLKQEYAGGVICECGKGSWVFSQFTKAARFTKGTL